MTEKHKDPTESGSGDSAPDPAADLEGQNTPAGAGLELLDNAAPSTSDMDPSLIPLRRKAQDPTVPLEERLEAFEDIVESEVGDTSLSRARNIEREVGLRQLFLKFEGGNPTGSQKDRIASAQVKDALRRGFDAITVATCGNYGAAMALAASLGGIRALVFIPAGYQTKRLQEIAGHGAEIIRVDGDYENAVQKSRETALSQEVYDANPGGPNTSIQLQAYGEIAYEIYDELRDAPRVVAIPTSNGTTVAGIHKGFASLYRRGKTSRIPHVVAGSSFRKNPIVLAWMKGLPHCVDLDPSRVKETQINEPLINWHSIDGDHALQAIRQTGGWAGYGSDRGMQAMARMVREKEGLNVLPASVAGLIALLDRHAKQPLSNDRYVAVLTGRKS